MPRVKYNKIYEDLKQKIERGVYRTNTYLPSEYSLIKEYDCSRNTVRRAIEQLGRDGYIQSMHGKGVIVIYDMLTGVKDLPDPQEIDSMYHEAEQEGHSLVIKVLALSPVEVDEALSGITGFVPGERCVRADRVFVIDGEAVSLEKSLFKASCVRGLDKEKAAGSIYRYMEEELDDMALTIQQKITIQAAGEEDKQYLDLKEHGSVAVIRKRAFNMTGSLFEFTEVRRRPDWFVVIQQIRRKKKK